MTDFEARHLARSFPPKPVSFVRGEGHTLWTADGTPYVDLGGASQGVANFGHNHPRIVQAIHEQTHDLVYVGNTIPSAVRGAFLDRLHRMLPQHLEKSFLCNSGTEAVEAAIKFAVAATGRSKFVALKGSFHGRTLGSLSVTFRPQYRKPFAKVLQEVTFVTPNDEAALAAAVGPDTAAVILEPVQGEGGLTVLTDAFMRAAERIAHDAGALLIADEVQSGMGRTGRNLAIEHSGAKPDIVCLGKSLAGGLPIGVASMTEAVAAKMPPGGHGTTFGGGPLVCAAGSAALDVLRDERLAEQAAASGAAFHSRLAKIQEPVVREIRGRGLMLGVDLRAKAQPLLDELLVGRRLALSAGPTVVRFLPPLAIPEAELAAASDALAAVLARMKPAATEEASA